MHRTQAQCPVAFSMIHYLIFKCFELIRLSRLLGRELLVAAGGADHGFADLLGAVPADGSPWGPPPMPLGGEVNGVSEHQAALGGAAAMAHPPADEPAAANAAAEPAAAGDGAAFDWLLPFVDAMPADEVLVSALHRHVDVRVFHWHEHFSKQAEEDRR